MHENYFSSIFFFTISILMDFRYFVTLRFYGTIFESGVAIFDWTRSMSLVQKFICARLLCDEYKKYT